MRIKVLQVMLAAALVLPVVGVVTSASAGASTVSPSVLTRIAASSCGVTSPTALAAIRLGYNSAASTFPPRSVPTFDAARAAACSASVPPVSVPPVSRSVLTRIAASSCGVTSPSALAAIRLGYNSAASTFPPGSVPTFDAARAAACG